MKNFTPEKENLVYSSAEKDTYYYCDITGNPSHKSKVIFKDDDKIIFHPYSVSRIDGSIRPKKIKTIELVGWDDIHKIPKDVKRTGKYGFKTLRLRQLFQFIYPRFPEVDHVVFTNNLPSKFYKKKIVLKWQDIEPILKEIGREKLWYDRARKILINNGLSEVSSKFANQTLYISGGQLSAFLAKFKSYDKVTKADVAALTDTMQLIPSMKIQVTTNFIKTRDQINKIYIEDIIKQFEKLLKVKSNNEKQWQNFFAKHVWLMNHLFPFEVILYKKEAFVGGKTISNTDGRVVDFLFQNGFQDNFALLEIKTHKKKLLKKSPYREPNVFSYSDDLSGGIGQCLDQKDQFIKEFGRREKIIDPRTILIIGNKSELYQEQVDCFELLRSNQKNVEIFTFDELLSKIKGLLRVISK